MPPRTYSPFHTLMQRLAASKPGAWMYARLLHHLDQLSFKASGERTTLTRVLSGLPVVVVTTTGARSGLPRTWPLLYIQDPARPGSFGLVATNWGQRHYPAWYFNLKANPGARCSIEGRSGQYLAHEASGEDYDRWWRAAEETYVGYPLYKERISGRHIPIMVMTPAGP
jgi:deazaflavin-dependent oxidoreductase (nitroreductase family)